MQTTRSIGRKGERRSIWHASLGKFLVSDQPNSRYTFVSAMGASALASIYVPFSEATGLSLDQLNVGAGYSYLFIGLSVLVLQPATLAFGKRPVYVFSTFAAAAVTFWTAYVDGYSQWIANRLLIGFLSGPSFSLVEVSIADIVSVRWDALLTDSSFCTSDLPQWASTSPSCTWARYLVRFSEATFISGSDGKLSS